jgi:glycosyltransferase involved in cell wall biosynthesis
MTKVMHVISSFSLAGAENMLCALVSRMDSARFNNEIVSLTSAADLASRVQAIGVRVRTLNMKPSTPNPFLVLRLAQWMREFKPDIIHTWMYHANLIGTAAASLAGTIPVVWAIHHSVLDPRVDKRRTLLVNRICALLSRKFPARIVCCSEATLRAHKNLGYAAEKLEVIPNGFDLHQDKPDPKARLSVRKELGIPAETILIGMAARFHPLKDHRNFIRAAARLHGQIPNVQFLLCGSDVTWQNSTLAEWIDEAGIREICHLLGQRSDMPRLFASMDIVASASVSEAFPLVIGEAMACGTPCVVTDVGDSAVIVDHTGEVVPPSDPEALADAWRRLVLAGSEVRRRLGLAARQRVQRHFALPATVERYQSVYERSLNGSTAPVPSQSFS